MNGLKIFQNNYSMFHVRSLIVFFTIIFIIPCLSLPVWAGEIDLTLESLDLSGFLRMRAFYTASKSKVPGKFSGSDEYQSVDYQDLFMRNRLSLKVIPELEVTGVFDIYSAFGSEGGGFALGSGSTNLITRNLYAVFSPNDRIQCSIGLKPFSLPGGYILARDATGLQYDHDVFSSKVKLYAAVINAFDDAQDSYGEDSDPAEYRDDNIYFGGLRWQINPATASELYYAYENDRFVSESDDKKLSLNWIGWHNNYVAGRWQFTLGGIYNWGSLWFRNEELTFDKTTIDAYLYEASAALKLDAVSFTLVLEGASGDPDNVYAEDSFQDIKASHGFTYFVVDNSGGIAFRGSGESSWYGLYGVALKIQFGLFNTLSVETILAHFETNEKICWDGCGSTYLGDEWDVKLEMPYRDVVSLFFNNALFQPGDAYNGLESVQVDNKGLVIESMIGLKIMY